MCSAQEAYSKVKGQKTKGCRREEEEEEEGEEERRDSASEVSNYSKGFSGNWNRG
jgi:hypothetical protein